jgi:uncharacterized membrane protein
MTETQLRTIVRTLTYRALAILVTAAITGLSTALVIHVICTIVHYGHERLWLKINWGKI